VEALSLEQFAIQISWEESGGFMQDITLALLGGGKRKGSIKTRTYMREYTMKLEFGTAKDGKIPGKIHLRLPDEAGSFVVGTFEAEIK
jgi:hypothetical protein